MKLCLDPTSTLPLHQQVERILRNLVEKPDFQNGSLFPREVDIAQDLGIARNTVRQGIGKLVQEGLLVRKKGVGTIVVQNKIYTRLENWFSFTKEMESKGMRVINRKIELSAEKANAELATIFHIKLGAEVIKVVRLRGSEEKPYLLTISWFHPRIKVRLDQDFSRPLYKVLEEENGVIVSLSREDISAIAASEDLAAQLEIEEGDPVLTRNRVVFNSDGLVVEYNKVFYRGDGISYSVEIGR